ncbi:MAG: hypothetical protein ACLGGX_11505 [Bdellovibrionia bacterium]
MKPGAKVLIGLLIVLSGVGAHSEESEVLAGREYDVEQDELIALRAKTRSYPGGQDEGDLQVQKVLPNPVRKLGPTSEFESTKPKQNNNGH